MFIEWRCTHVEVFFNSDVEGVWLYFLYKIYGILSIHAGSYFGGGGLLMLNVIFWLGV